MLYVIIVFVFRHYRFPFPGGIFSELVNNLLNLTRMSPVPPQSQAFSEHIANKREDRFTSGERLGPDIKRVSSFTYFRKIFIVIKSRDCYFVIERKCLRIST